MNSNRFIFILGMHRSGTSCLAGALEKCGLYLGDVRRTGRFNAKGYYEIKAVQRVHDQILGLNRGSWDAPPHSVLLHPYHRQTLGKIVDQLSEHPPPCGLKDPRLLLLLDIWLDLIKVPYLLVGTFRHPQAVVQSLLHRNGMAEEAGYRLWLHYNSALMRRHQMNPFPLVEFDLSDAASYCRKVMTLASSCGLNPHLSQLQKFVSPNLEHHPVSGTVPPLCREVYTYLQRHRLYPIDPSCAFSVSGNQQTTYPPSKERPMLRRHYRHYLDTTKSFVRTLTTDFSQIRYFVVFIGNPRSGTTLVRSLLDAHPHIILGNEVNAVERLVSGESIKLIMGRILQCSSRFASQPFWEGYSYRIPGASVGNSRGSTVIGDKKAGRTARLFMQDMSLLELLQKQIPVPVRFVHCVRHPFDVITTKTRHNANSLEWNIEQYFRLEQTSAEVARLLKPEQYKRIYLEQIIEKPTVVLQNLLQFLDLRADEDYLEACRSIIYQQPNLSRFNYEWSAENIAVVEKKTLRYDHLSCYLDQGKLLFCLNT